MKIAAVYTSTTPELIEMVNQQLNAQFKDDSVTIVSYQDPSILQEARDNGGVTPGCARRLLNLYEQAVKDGANILFNICSSVGDVAKLAKPLYEMTGVKFVRIDEDMAMEAVRKGNRIGVVATLRTTLEPTKRLIQDCAKVLGKEVVLVDALADGAFGLNQEDFKQMLIDTCSKVKDQVDIFLFAQGSMAYAEEAVSRAVGMPVLSSIRFGTAAVRKAADSMK
ncbi:MAG TPA: Asp/Glu/hydantoin racemase [Clostridiaceae bacterium]|nr:Asp/Glu/hydantoin racemase [Clostridiaceae bacterium]